MMSKDLERFLLYALQMRVVAVGMDIWGTQNDDSSDDNPDT